MARRGHRPYQFRYQRLVLLLVSGLVALVSLSTVLQTYAMPVEARTSEPWYAYQSSVGFAFQAQVRTGRFYESATVTSDELVKARQPVEPPQYRRVLISKFTDAIEISIPYYYKADREAKVTATLNVEGVLTVPRLWQRPYPLLPPKNFEIQGTEISGRETFVIPVAKLLADIDSAREVDLVNLEPLQLLIRPVFEVKAEGLQQPVTLVQNPEFQIDIRKETVELDDAKEVKADKTFAETRVVPLTVAFLGADVSVGALRRGSMIALGVSLAVLVLLFWYRKRQTDPLTLLRKLGANLLVTQTFELPAGTAIADVHNVKELLLLQAQAERPVIMVDDICYLMDGATCYRFYLKPKQPEPAAAPPEPEAPADPLSMAIRADAFTLDPWITEVHVHSGQALLDLHVSTGRAIIRTDRGYHLLDGSVCFTYLLPEADTQRALDSAAAARQSP